MKINILHLADGARAARGITVIIDVFRAFSVEAYLFDRGAERVIPTSSVESALELKKKYPNALLVGERGGAKIEGFDFGNSPSQLKDADVSGRVIIHTTSAGTQGVANATHASEIIGGSLVCAKAIADYIRKKDPDEVSLVCMGLAAERDTDEDILCAEYIRSLLLENPLSDMKSRIERLKETDGKKFFAPENSEIFPKEDFDMCVRVDALPFVVRLTEDDDGTRYMQRV
jgi:2-phosphosulfolactate phosphatase